MATTTASGATGLPRLAARPSRMTPWAIYLGRTLYWEGKQLTSVTDGTHSYSYSYNEDGLRLRKVVDGTDTEYYYNGSVLMYMISRDT